MRPKASDLEAFTRENDKLLELVRELYGLCDARDNRGVKIHNQLMDDLEMTPLVGDATVYVRYGLCSRKGSLTCKRGDLASSDTVLAIGNFSSYLEEIFHNTKFFS